jgi:hypothetical protein
VAYFAEVTSVSPISKTGSVVVADLPPALRVFNAAPGAASGGGQEGSARPLEGQLWPR